MANDKNVETKANAPENTKEDAKTEDAKPTKDKAPAADSLEAFAAAEPEKLEDYDAFYAAHPASGEHNTQSVDGDSLDEKPAKPAKPAKASK